MDAQESDFVLCSSKNLYLEARKIFMRKRIFAMLVALIMAISLFPVTALAAASEEEAVKYGTYGDNGWTEKTDCAGSIVYEGEGVTLSKVATSTGTVNEYTITLTVETTTTSSTTAASAATVLVIDTSGSMGWCAECGEEDWHKSSCKYHSYNPLRNFVRADQSRMAAAKDAANSFIGTYAGDTEGSGRYLAIVSFSTNVGTTTGWLDVSNEADYDEALNAIDALGAGGGTNLERGLYTANEKLKHDTVKDISYKNVIALTDGEPTYYDTTPNGGGSYCDEKTYTETKKTAADLKEKTNATLYTVCFGVANERMKKYESPFGALFDEYWNITVGKYLETEIATSKDHAYNAEDADDLSEAFESITETITSGISAGTVNDPLPEGGVVTAGKGYVETWKLDSEDAKTTTNGNTTTYTYTKTYTVTIDPTKTNEDYQPLNGETTFTSGETVLEFPVPAGKVTYPQTPINYTVTYKAAAHTNLTTAVTHTDLSTGDQIPAAPTVTADSGYTLGSWRLTSGTEGAGNTVGTTDLEYTLTVNPNTYKVHFDIHGGDAGNMSDQNFTYDVAQPLTKNAFSKTGYDFVGWNTAADGSGTPYTDQQSVNNLTAENGAIVDLYAQWTPKQYGYTVEYYYDDVKGAAPTGAPTGANSNFGTNVTIDPPNSVTITTGEGDDAVTNTYTLTSTNHSVKIGTGTNVIRVDYALDNWHDANPNNTDDKDSETGGDNIPDYKQVRILYTATTGGSVAPKLSIVTIQPDYDGKYIAKVTDAGSTATANKNYTFKKWTNDFGAPKIANATTGAITIANAEGGKTYTFTANFAKKSTPYNPPVAPKLNKADHYAYVVGYPDGTVQPQGAITRAEVATIFFRLLSDETRDLYWTKNNAYTDVKAGDWFNNAVSTLSNAGIINGYPDGTFRPNAPITRAEMAKVIAMFAELDKDSEGFKDIAGHWAEAYIKLAAGNGWIAGYPDGTFRPNQYITRAETMTMINRVLERVPSEEEHLLSHRVMLTFPDNQPGDWYYIAVQEATNSHTYERYATEKNGDEQWIKLIDNYDWTKLEF